MCSYVQQDVLCLLFWSPISVHLQTIFEFTHTKEKLYLMYRDRAKEDSAYEPVFWGCKARSCTHLCVYVPIYILPGKYFIAFIRCSQITRISVQQLWWLMRTEMLFALMSKWQTGKGKDSLFVLFRAVSLSGWSW